MNKCVAYLFIEAGAALEQIRSNSGSGADFEQSSKHTSMMENRKYNNLITGFIVFVYAVFLFTNCNDKKQSYSAAKDTVYFDSIAKNDKALEDPLLGEWRFYHKEDTQRLIHYQQRNPKKATYGITKLYLQPLGKFSDKESILIDKTREYLEAFYQLETEVLEPISADIIPDTARRMHYGKEQLNTSYILHSMLKGNIPGDGYALMAITNIDLYPSPDWNFVFGIASYSKRVGVSSIARLYNDNLEGAEFNKCLRRITSIASHEIGHMFSISHCVMADCCMNGANTLQETDQSTTRLCSECQRKLYWNIGYDNRKRLNALEKFFKENNLEEDAVVQENDKVVLKIE